MCIGLETCSVNWLEPHKRSEYLYDKANLDKENSLIILDDPEVVRKAIDVERQPRTHSSYLERTIDKHFGGDISTFQERWKEYYQNWWPDEFKGMQEATDNMKAWLITQKE